MPFSKVKRWVALVAVNIAVLFITAEALGLAHFYYQNGNLFYSKRPHYEPVRDTNQDSVTKHRLHPLFGFISNLPETEIAGGLLVANNYGFYSEHIDYPLAKKDNQFIIGIFGGSVSEQIYVKSRNRLIETLQQYEFFKNKEIVVLLFGQGGFKQPQQLLILNYFLAMGQEFDMVINIDGFNEVVLSGANYRRGTEIALPSEGHMLRLLEIIQQSTLTSEKLQALARIDRYQSRLNDVGEIINANRLASVNFVLEQYYAIQYNQYQQTILAYQQLPIASPDHSLMYLNQARPVQNIQVLYEQIAAHWAESSMLMSDLLTARSIPYFHFLQPNQYHTDRKFSPEEAEIALNEQHPYRRGAIDGYPYLVAATKRLHNHGVDFYSGLHVFDQVEGIVYADDCCHYSQLGSDILADFMAQVILESDAFSQVIHTAVSRN